MIVPIIKWTEFHSEMPPTFRIVSFPSAGLLMPPWVGLVPQHAPVHALSESEHFLYFTDTQFPWMSGYNDLPPPPQSGGCVRDYWLVCGVEGRAVPRHTTGTAWHCSATHPEPVIQQCYVFSQDDGKNPHMMGAKS